MSDSEMLTKLKQAYFSGLTQVSMNGRTVAYRSLAEMRQVMRELEAKIASETERLTKVTAKLVR